jgi:hypothetical protein
MVRWNPAIHLAVGRPVCALQLCQATTGKHKYFYGYTHKKSDATKDGTWFPGTRAPFCRGQARVTRPTEYTFH